MGWERSSGHGWAQSWNPAVIIQLWARAERTVPRAVQPKPACARLWMDPDPPGRCWQELVMAQLHWGGLSSHPLPGMCPGSSQKPGVKLRDRSLHPASPTSPRQFHELCRSPEAMGMGALGHAGHGCYPAWRKGGQSLPAPCKAAPTPDQHAFPLPRCPQAPPPCGARLGWPLCPLTADTAPSGAGGCWRWEEAPPQLTSDGAVRPCLRPPAAPRLSPAREVPWGR